MYGKNIRIYLSNGTVSGIRHAEIDNWTGQAISCPRNRISELNSWSESKRPGIYFLFGADDQTLQQNVYIGEAESVYDRILNHVANKEFWNEIIFFTSKDENLTKAHVKYLEARLVDLSSQANRYILENNNSPQKPLLPKGDRDAMEEFIERTGILLGVLGHRLLQPLARREANTDASKSKSEAIVEQKMIPLSSEVYSLNVKGIKASAIRTDEGIVVFGESQAAKDIKTSLSDGCRRIRDSLISQGIWVNDGDLYKFTKDWLFSSPSQAAAVIVGYSINGRDSWRTEKGISLGAIESQLVS